MTSILEGGVMARIRNPNRDKAFEIYKERCGKITTKKIAELLGESERTVSSWRSLDDWKGNYNPKGGAPRGNKNALGNSGGAKAENQNARKHGMYSKLFPKATFSIIEMLEGLDPVEMLWQNIKIKYAQILHAQKIMHVRSKNDITKELKKKSPGKFGDMEEYNIQFAWDKEASFLKAQSTAMSTLTRMIKEYEELIHKNQDIVSEEQRLRVEKLKSEILADKDKVKDIKVNFNIPRPGGA
jgi:uncharacterized protein YjcR